MNVTDLMASFQQILSQNIWLSFLLALLAGIMSSFSPCVLSTVPLIMGYVGGYAGNDRAKAVKYSLAFCLGLVVTFTALGAVAGLLGKMMVGAGKWWYLFLGFLLSVVGFQLLGVINIGPRHCGVSGGTDRKGLAGAFLVGMAGGALSSPCATPVLVAILAFVAGQGNIVWGIGLLTAYAVGHCTLVFLAGISIAFVHSLSASPSTERISRILKTFLGFCALAGALYLFYIGF